MCWLQELLIPSSVRKPSYKPALCFWEYSTCPSNMNVLCQSEQNPTFFFTKRFDGDKAVQFLNPMCYTVYSENSFLSLLQIVSVSVHMASNSLIFRTCFLCQSNEWESQIFNSLDSSLPDLPLLWKALLNSDLVIGQSHRRTRLRYRSLLGLISVFHVKQTHDGIFPPMGQLFLNPLKAVRGFINELYESEKFTRKESNSGDGSIELL